MNKIIFGVFGTAGIAIGSMLGAPPGQATVVVSGTSDGSTFSNCVGLGCASGSFQTLTLNSTAPGGGDSVLSILPNSFSASDPTDGLVLAELSLAVGNKPGAGGGTLTFDYNIVLPFVVPGGSHSTSLHLSFSGNGGSGSNGDVTLSGLTPDFLDALPLTPTLNLVNFRFVDVGSAGSFLSETWTIKKTSNPVTLELLADLVDPPAPIPEPSSVTLVGASLAGLGIAGRRRRKL